MTTRFRPALTFAARVAATLALACAGTSAALAADPKVLNVYNWSDYIADDTLKNFEKETGIKVNYDNYDSNEVLMAKLVAGNSGYDIVVPSSHFAKLQIQGGLLQKLDRSKLTNWGNLDPTLLKSLETVDPGNQYLVDWLWGFVTVGINKDKVKAALGNLPMPDNAWSLIFDPKYASKLKSCGVNFLDSASEVLPVALMYVGKPAYSSNAADYDAAAKMLASVRPYVTRFSSSGYINDLAGGSLCAVMGYSGDINIARARALEANPKQPPAIEALIPKGGATLFFDTMAIPKDAKNVENAHLFINYILRPEVAASLTNKVFYANPNRASLKFVKKDVAENKTIFLSDADKSHMTAPDAVPQAIQRTRTRVFTNFKAGK
ncbi:MAG TPA: polyamine ABC transporter substrate-binding protein [Caldimonas sp.]|jgi:putrescine transport system substrate-binding protein|nr:polyamine ABC transporter substrate-binding protein [Caldimonas sp.]